MEWLARGAAVVCALIVGAGASAVAADWPTKPIRLVVPYLAGGAADVVGRNFAEALGTELGQQFVVENRTGGAGLPGTEAVARAAPDGYTLVVSGLASHVLAPAVSKAPPYDPVRDFTHIAYFGGTPDVFAVHPSAGLKSFADLLAAGRASKDGIQYVSPSQGSGGHVAAEFLASKTGMKLAHVAYRGGGGAVVDLIAGHVKLGSMTMSTLGEHLKAGSLVGLGVTSDKRLEEFPDLPTLKEMGYPDLVTLTWYGLSGPRALPAEIVERLSQATRVSYAKPMLQTALKRQTFVGEHMTPAEFSAHVAAEVAKWGPVVKLIAKPE